jgi:C-terminal processing protease CtpA/Prc
MATSTSTLRIGRDARFRLARLVTRGSLLWLACVTSPACAARAGTIGAIIAQAPDGRLFLREVPDNLAAERAGLRPGDELLLIDGRDVRALNTEQIHQDLSGDVGEKVKLTVIRGEEVLRVTLKRTPAPNPRQPPKQ